MIVLFAILAALLMGAVLAHQPRQADARTLRPVPIPVRPPRGGQPRLPRP